MHGIQCCILDIAFGESKDIEGIIESNNYETTIMWRVKRQATNSKIQLKKKKKNGKVHKNITKTSTRRKITMQVHSIPCESIQWVMVDIS